MQQVRHQQPDPGVHEEMDKRMRKRPLEACPEPPWNLCPGQPKKKRILGEQDRMSGAEDREGRSLAVARAAIGGLVSGGRAQACRGTETSTGQAHRTKLEDVGLHGAFWNQFST